MHERKTQGLTQTQLAGLSGVGITFLSNLENGKQTAELGKTLNVLATLGLTFSQKGEAMSDLQVSLYREGDRSVYLQLTTWSVHRSSIDSAKSLLWLSATRETLET